MNRLESGNRSVVSVFQCRYEKTLIRLADETAVSLRQTDPARFARYFKNQA